LSKKDGCKKVGLVCENVISGVDIINSQSCQIQVTGKSPTVSIDKTDGVQVYLSKDGLETEIFSSKSSEMNVLIPGKSEDDDMVFFSFFFFVCYFCFPFTVFINFSKKKKNRLKFLFLNNSKPHMLMVLSLPPMLNTLEVKNLCYHQNKSFFSKKKNFSPLHLDLLIIEIKNQS